MDTQSLISIGLAGGLPMLGGLVWAIRLEGRMDAHEAVDDQRALSADHRHAEIQTWLARVEAKLDNAISR